MFMFLDPVASCSAAGSAPSSSVTTPRTYHTSKRKLVISVPLFFLLTIWVLSGGSEDSFTTPLSSMPSGKFIIVQLLQLIILD